MISFDFNYLSGNSMSNIAIGFHGYSLNFEDIFKHLVFHWFNFRPFDKESRRENIHIFNGVPEDIILISLIERTVFR